MHGGQQACCSAPSRPGCLLTPASMAPHVPTRSAATKRCWRRPPLPLSLQSCASACRPLPCASASWPSTGEQGAAGVGREQLGGLGRGWGTAGRNCWLSTNPPARPWRFLFCILPPLQCLCAATPLPAAPRARWSTLWTTTPGSSTSWRSTPACRCAQSHAFEGVVGWVLSGRVLLAGGQHPPAGERWVFEGFLGWVEVDWRSAPARRCAAALLAGRSPCCHMAAKAGVGCSGQCCFASWRRGQHPPAGAAHLRACAAHAPQRRCALDPLHTHARLLLAATSPAGGARHH